MPNKISIINQAFSAINKDHGSLAIEEADQIGKVLNELDKNKEELMMLSRENYYNQLTLSKDLSKVFKPFYYQKQAVREFIYKFARKGILSDQVGMGKTIEAGMILSELACRQELKSLLILVPGATMVYKWEKELCDKFGIRNNYEDIKFGNEVVKQQDFPKIVTVNDKDDLNVLLFDALDKLDQDIDLFPGVNFNDMVQESLVKNYDRIISVCKKELSSFSTISNLEKRGSAIFRKVVVAFVEAICKDLATRSDWPKDSRIKRPDFEKYRQWEAIHPVDVDSVYTLISDYYANTCVNEDEFISKCLDKTVLKNSIISQFGFCKAEYGELVKQQVKSKVEDGKMTDEQKRVLIASLAEQIRKTFAVMIVGNEKKDGKYWLEETLFDYKDPSLQYLYGPELKYSYFDLLIDIHFSTLIVDEAHNYIEVVSKNPRDYSDGSEACLKNNLFYLFEKGKNQPGFDQYLVKRSCLYSKLLTLSNHAQQKMFMTATPIKSDMIDFYLLNLLCGRDDHLDFSLDRIDKDKKTQVLDYNTLASNAYSILQKAIHINMEMNRPLSQDMFNFITKKDLVCNVISEMRYKFFESEQWDKLKERKELRDQRSVAEELILFRVNHFAEYEDWQTAVDKFQSTNKKLVEAPIVAAIKEALNDEKIAFIVYEMANHERTYFEQNFREENGHPIKTIQSLVSSAKGMEEWRNKYSTLGIRTTRHQTDDIQDPWLALLKPERQVNYGPGNLPVWSRRNGVVINICRTDRYFDYVARVNMNNLVSVLRKDDNTPEKIHIKTALERANDARNKAQEWGEDEKKLKKDLEVLKSRYMDNEEDSGYKRERQTLIHDFKEKIAKYLYTEVIDDGMAGTCHSIQRLQAGFPDYLDSRMHMLIALLQGAIEGIDAIGIESQAKVLVFTKEEINDKLFNKLTKEFEKMKQVIAEGSDACEKYEKSFAHEPFDGTNWTISNNINSLKENKNVLVVVPANKYEEGVDLQMATHLVNFDILHGPLAMEQRIGRIDRVKPKNNANERDIYIYAFTPLNDWSGFSTSFLAYYLHLFSRWNGDTTGIVSFPVAEKENVSTFDAIVKEMESVYTILSDHAEGDAVKSVYDEVKRTLKKVPTNSRGYNCSPELHKAIEQIREKISKSLRFKYKDNEYLGAEYMPSSEAGYENLDRHIDRQATIMSRKLRLIFRDMASNLGWEEPPQPLKDGEAPQDYWLRTIFDELKGEGDDFEYESCDSLSRVGNIANDLRFLYYQHYFLDVSSHNVGLYEKTNGVDPIADRQHVANPHMYFLQNEQYEIDSATLQNAWDAYWSGEMLQTTKNAAPKQEAEDDTPKAFLRQTGGTTNETVDYNALLEKQKAEDAVRMGFYRDLKRGNVKFEGISEGTTVFTIYNNIVNKYMYHMLAMYIYLCRQVKKRLNNMAEIIKDGAVEDLISSINENTSEFRNVAGGNR